MVMIIFQQKSSFMKDLGKIRVHEPDDNVVVSVTAKADM